jgi:hypothetical protein
MNEHEEFMRRAAFCVSFAASIDDPGPKAALLEMAQRWRELAVQASHREQDQANTTTNTANAAATIQALQTR